jgi:hypothetical protein
MSAQNPISDKELLAIQRRVEAATPGEWQVANDGVRKRGNSIRTAWNHPQLHGPHPVVTLAVGIKSAKDPSAYMAVSMSPEDAEFIAHARTDVPKLLAEINRLKAKLEEADNLLKDEMGIG